MQSRVDLAKRIAWLKCIPTNDLVARGFIEASKDKVFLLEQTLAFFRVASVEAWHEGWSCKQFAFRKSQQTSALDGRLATWLQMAEYQAEQMAVEPFNKSQLRKAVSEIRSLTTAEPDVFVPDMIAQCAEAGVALCLIPEIPGAKISGAAKWLSPHKAMIAMNLRGKKNDLFWFTFFHEAGHILHDSKKEVYVDVSYSCDPREDVANDFARRTLIPSRYDDRLKSLKSEQDVRDFATEITIDPGIVVGRLQHDKIVAFSHLNHLKSTFHWGEGG